MTPIVEQLQHDALDRDVPVSDLLRKAKVVAVKLSLDEAVEWIELELAGYRDRDRIPDYRELRGQPKAFNPVRGWVPIMFTGDDELQGVISECKLHDSISELEYLAKGEGPLNIPFGSSHTAVLAKAFEIEPTPMALYFGRDRVVGVLDAVRNRVLDWAMELEKAGILGDGLSFSPKEKAAANNPNVTYNIAHIANVSGAIGPVSGAASVTSIQLNESQVGELSKLVKQIGELKDRMGLTESQDGELGEHIEAIDEELKKDQLDDGRIKGILRSIKSISESTTGNVVATGVVNLIDKILASM